MVNNFYTVTIIGHIKLSEIFKNKNYLIHFISGASTIIIVGTNKLGNIEVYQEILCNIIK
jgi:hypothetical protein